MQDHGRNSDTSGSPGSDRSEIFSGSDSDENFIRSGFPKLQRSINVLLEPTFLFEFPDEADGLIGAACTELRHDIDQRAFDILCHPFGVAADVDIGAFGQPGPQLAAALA